MTPNQVFNAVAVIPVAAKIPNQAAYAACVRAVIENYLTLGDCSPFARDPVDPAGKIVPFIVSWKDPKYERELFCRELVHFLFAFYEWKTRGIPLYPDGPMKPQADFDLLAEDLREREKSFPELPDALRVDAIIEAFSVEG